MIRRITKLGWLAIIVIVSLVLIGMNHMIHANGSTTKTANQLDRKTNIQRVEKIPSIYSKINLYVETVETDVYKWSIQTLATQREPINNEINQWMMDEKNAFLESLENDEAKENKAMLKVKLNIQQITDHFYHFIYTIKEKHGENMEQHRKKVFNINLKRGDVLSIDDVLVINDNTLKIIRNQVTEVLDVPTNDQQWDEILNQTEKWNWSINSEALRLYFNGETEGDQSANPNQVDLPLQKLYVYLNEDIASLIDMPQEQQQEMGQAIQAEKEKLLQERKQKESARKKHQEKPEIDPNKKYVALTFDDGPSAEHTPRILDTLAQHGAQATFFMLGSQVNYHPEVARQVAEAGHEIGNHTREHLDLTTLGTDGIHSEIQQASDTIYQATGARSSFVRPPYGAYNASVLTEAANHNNAIILWSVDSLDWKNRRADTIIKTIQEEITSGAIVLMHDIHAATAEALPELLDTLEKDGYQFVTVSQLLDIQANNGVGPFYGNVKR